MDKCEKCDGHGWVPYYKVINNGYYTEHFICNKCDGKGGFGDNNSIKGRLGHTGFVLGSPPK